MTEAADEAVVGIEMVQAFGREDDVRGRFGEKAEAVRDTVLRQAGVEARHLPGLYYLPALSIAAVVFFGGRAGDRRPPVDRRVRPLRDAAAPARLAARGARLDHEPRAARARVGGPQLRVARGDRAAARAGRAAGTCRPGRSASASRACTSPTAARTTCCTSSTSSIEPGEIVAVCGPTGAGQDVAPQSAAALLRPDRRPRARRRRRHARPRRSPSCAPTSRS